MKKVLCIIPFLVLSSCASYRLPEEKGTACLMVATDTDEVRCWPVRVYTDPTRFHQLREWDRKNLEKMPSLP